ncbi:lipid-A-disaccharide synthase [Estrella lausannensis]|uniref:Lipid-A-disaccharide synthase n=1 Tax=Estrella lausannensis TaxID=483423 RepID=A0A0H5DNP7_9BACT|nr:lipid-A-disaccharide synthase [Estrella lausannensis]CRX37892.1 Lipid A disaccharide synthase [Estrella lausannensis]
MSKPLSFFLLAGEPSGDIHGKRMIASLKKIDPGSTFYGVGGPSMLEEGLIPLFRMEELAVMGFQEIILSLPSLIKKLFFLSGWILEKKPHAVVLIDFPDFNLLLARLLRRGGFRGKIVQMIPPTVWAWRKGRIRTLEKHFDLALSIYPFEKKIYQNTKLPVTYIGNPVLEAVSSHRPDFSFRSRFGFDEKDPIIALFPGSRRQEVHNNLLLQLEALKLATTEAPKYRVAVSLARQEMKEEVEKLIRKAGFEDGVSLIPASSRYDLMDNCMLAIAKSGTVTLELALKKRPAVVTYAVSSLNYFIARYIVRLDLTHFAIANILSGEELFPEHIADRAPKEAVATSIRDLLSNEPRRQSIQQKQEQLFEQLAEARPEQEIEKAMRSLLR